MLLPLLLSHPLIRTSTHKWRPVSWTQSSIILFLIARKSTTLHLLLFYTITCAFRAPNDPLIGEGAQSTPNTKGRANRRKLERENKRKRGELARINHRHKLNAQQKRESGTEVEFSNTGISDIKVAKSGRQGVLGIHPSLKGWEKLDLAQKQELLAPFQVVLQEP